MSQVIGFVPFRWGTWIEFLAPGFNLAPALAVAFVPVAFVQKQQVKDL